MTDRRPSIPFSHPRIAGSSERYSVCKMTSPSFRSAFVGTLLVWKANVSPGTIVPLGRFARTTERYMANGGRDECTHADRNWLYSSCRVGPDYMPPGWQDASAFFWISQPSALSHFDCDKDYAEKALPATLSHHQIMRQPLKALPLIENNSVVHRTV
jgi:hypothetical protein